MSAGSRVKQLISITKSIPLPDLSQGGTLVIRSHSPNIPLNVRLIPQWRDDGHLKLEQTLPPLSLLDQQLRRSDTNGDGTGGGGEPFGDGIVYTDTNEEMDLHIEREHVSGNLGSLQISVLVDYNRTRKKSVPSSSNDVVVPPSSPSMPFFGITNKHDDEDSDNDDNNSKKIITDDGTFLSSSQTQPPTARQVPYNDGITHCTNSEPHGIDRPSPSMTLTATIPEKCNVSCFLNGAGGDIHVEGKLEGEHGFEFVSAAGNMNIKKLRGDSISLTASASSSSSSSLSSYDSGSDDDSITGNNPNGAGTIHVTKSLEAQDLNIQVGQGGRFRAKMINVSNATIDVTDTIIPNQQGPHHKFEALDEDDGLALIDISSIYASQSGDGAYLTVPLSSSTSDQTLQQYTTHDQGGSGTTTDHVATKEGVISHEYDYPKKVRVKSNHGHVSVRTTSTSLGSTMPNLPLSRNQRCSLVELGGVNGSFDVLTESVITTTDDDESSHHSNQEYSQKWRVGANIINGGGGDENNNDKDVEEGPIMAANIHIGSLSPGQVSILTSDRGDLGMTFDRKVESDVRLLSCPFVSDLDVGDIMGENEEELHDALEMHNTKATDYSNASSHRRREDSRLPHNISIQTSAFKEGSRFDRDNIEYMQGNMLNNSKEPDSRFEMKNTAGSGGKIRIEGAASQALWGHSGGKSGAGSDDDSNSGNNDGPLVVAVTDGFINVESLSWFGAIARRYGVVEEEKNLGRQASVPPAEKKKTP